VHGYYASYAVVGLLAVLGVVFVAVGITLNRFVRPHRPTQEKRTTYECGVDPVGAGWAQTQVRYFVYAFLYVVFAVESVFLFPWATVFDRPGFGWGALIEMGIFIAYLLVGLVYAWRRKVLTWL
jgi:NADH-quinone oxidoreductase subunit A